MKIDIGCGLNKHPGFWGIDRRPLHRIRRYMVTAYRNELDEISYSGEVRSNAIRYF
ncbi:hypothetical protein ACFQ88_03080 [Paenibacillus sp. NPDC056579]|uniref:hypothetical protein n=1 Tax=Paenibacillus sp. NPDC056579 TaxID=3345871 RepID=UPI0036768264